MRYKNGLIHNSKWINNKREGDGFLYCNEQDNEIINNK